MDWRVKAAIQATCAALPAGHRVYSVAQRRFGGHREGANQPWARLEQLQGLVSLLRGRGFDPTSARLLEIGTGWVPIAPIYLWLCGAAQTDTFDISRLLSETYLREALDFIRRDPARCLGLIESCDSAESEARLSRLLAARDPLGALAMAGVRYHAPADAARSGLPDTSVDCVYSVSVLEHVPPTALRRLLAESSRVLVDGGYLAHHIALEDHFAHADRRISTVNFLKFTDQQWSLIAGNHYAYHNRLRASEHLEMLSEAGFEVVSADVRVDPRAVAALRSALRPAPRFHRFAIEDLGASELTFVARRRARGC